MSEKGFAIVTGASRGLGKACALQMAKDGYDVVINYTRESSEPKAQALIEEIAEQYGQRAIAVQADVSDFNNCKKIVDAGVEAFGSKIDVLVNNAGIDIVKKLVDVSVEEIDRELRVNLFSQLYMTKLVVPYMMENKFGHIVNVSSNAGIMGCVDLITYSASKGGVIAMTKAMAKEFADYGIMVNSIAPGTFWTEMTQSAPKENLEYYLNLTPLHCFGDPEEMGLCLHYIVNSKFLTGQVISPNGGLTI